MPGDVVHEIFPVRVVGGGGQLRLEVSYSGEGCAPWYSEYGQRSSVIDAAVNAVNAMPGVTCSRGWTTGLTLRLVVNYGRTVDAQKLETVLIRAVLNAVQG